MGLLWGKLSPGVRLRRLDSRDDSREGQSMPGRRAYRDTALVRLPVIRGQLDPRLLEGELPHHPFPSFWQRTVMPAGR